MSAQLTYMPIASPRRISFNSSVIAVNTTARLVTARNLASFLCSFLDKVGKTRMFL